jgi:hypothetical protein
MFLEDNMIRRSMVAREISLQEKRVHVPTPMVEEPFFTLPVAVTPTVQDTIVPTHVASSPVGYIFTLAGGAISWKSSKQTVTTSSTMYVEFVACDNNPAVQYAHNNRSSGAAKHIDIKYYVVKDKVRDHIKNLEHISTEKMLADPLTKGLPPNVFREHVAGMGLRESL